MFMSGGEGFLDGTGAGQEWEDPGNQEDEKEVVIDPTIAERARQEKRREHQQSARDYIVTAAACAIAGVLAPIMINASLVTGSPYPRESALEDRVNDEIVIRSADTTIDPYSLNDRLKVSGLIGQNPNLNNPNFIGAAERIIQDNQSESWGSKNAGLVAFTAGLVGVGGTLWCSYMANRHHRSARENEGNTM